MLLTLHYDKSKITLDKTKGLKELLVEMGKGSKDI